MLYECNTFLLLFKYIYVKGKVMKVKTANILTRFIPLILITLIIVYATGLVDLSDVSPQTTYSDMSTKQLQKEVERLSQNGDLPFPMGIELIKRWTKNNGTIVNY